MLAICRTDVPVVPKAPKTSSHSEKIVPQGKNPRASSGLRRKQSSKHTSESKTKASKSKTGQSDKETQSSSAKDKSSSHPSSSTHVVIEMHKEEQQAAGGPASLGATSEERAHPQLSGGCDASADSTAKADLGKSAPNDSIPHQQGMDEGTKNYAPGHIFARTNPSVLVDQTKSARGGLKIAQTDLATNKESRSDEISKKIKLEDLSDLMKDTRSAFFTLDSPQDEPIIVLDESEEVDTKKHEDTHATSHDVPDDTSVPHPSSLESAQLQKLMAQVHLLRYQKDKLEQQKAKVEAEVASLKARPSYPDINQLTELLVDELKNIQWELPAEFLDLPSQVSSVQEKLKTLDSLPSLLKKVTDTMNRFATVVENASRATGKIVPSVGLTTASPAEGEKNTILATKDDETTNLHNELV
ncbi:hypothetical protein Tco_0757735, partial [Tanacetum coccineum]